MHVVYTGRVSAPEIANAFRDYHRDAGFDKAHDYLLDLTGVEHADLDFRKIMMVASDLGPIHKIRHDGAKSAFLAPKDVTFGIARMYQTAIEDKVNFEIGVFRTMQETLAFLGLDPAAFPDLDQA